MMSYLLLILYSFILCVILSCGGGASEQSSNGQQDTLRHEEDAGMRVEEANPDGVDEELQALMRQSKNVLEKQVREGANLYNEEGNDIPKEAFQKEELDALTFEINHFLWNNSYRDIDNTFFRQKIKEVFGIDLNQSEEKYVYINLLEIDCESKPYFHRNNGIDYNGFFVVNDGNFITDFYYLPELIDYASIHEDIVEIEKELPVKKWNPTYKIEVEIEKWSDLAQRNDEYKLEKRRKFNRLLTLNRNRYLFQNDKTRLDWLMENDVFFMESLVKQFGWTVDEDLLYSVVTQTRFTESNPDDFGRLFWKKNCDGSIKIHANTFKLLQTLYAPSAVSEVTWLMSDIQDYLEYMMGYQRYQPHLSITDKQRVEILANMVYFAEQYKYKELDNGQLWSYQKMMGRFRLMLREKEQKILKDNKYFGLPNFKAWWDAADYDEYYVDGEYNGPWGRDNEPMTESEWRKKRNQNEDGMNEQSE